MWTVNVSSLEGIDSVSIKMRIGALSVQACAVRSVGTGGHSCAFIINMMLSNIVM